MSRLKGKIALITGGARGIGLGIADRFIREGAHIVLLDVRQEELAASVEQLRQLAMEISTGTPSKVESILCDLADPANIEEAAETAWNVLGGIDIVINNAGIAVREKFTDIPFERWTKIMDINLNAMFLLSQTISKKMIQEGRPGSFVNMASKNGLAGSGMLAHYNASKGGVVLLTQSMAVDLASHGIRVNAVAPGFIDTPLDRELKAKQEETLNITDRTPMRRMGTIEETANAFLFLASDEASYITGTTLVVDGGHLAGAGDF
ncbi:SDR family NAD(P)-dependent oxidoreductase [Cohnella silvisoli]|uniref:SDR family NAD(P)-dependent oxidoreductase n=1 Tax=Cohnella silvisoli TaxID=2873699 RepID=A0ABV1L370_9BACL|nr:SDR family NAD(P)-dependent oxidoreductase [Cohnella silvisoli]MCD9026118.1 SDR family oxidoreductase [Cohnella silvisoli]